MKVYLASQYSWKDRLKEYAAELHELGIEVTSRWLEEPHATTTKISEVDNMLAIYAKQNLEDIYIADTLIAFSVDSNLPTLRGGRHVEFGYALALKKPIIVVGPKENIFHHLPEEYDIIHLSNWNSAVQQLISKRSRKE